MQMLNRSYKKQFQVADGSVTWKPDNRSENMHEIVVQPINGTPTAGVVSFAAKPRSGTEFVDIPGAQDLDITSQVFFHFTGNVEEYQITFLGVTGVTQVEIYDYANETSEPAHYSGPSILSAMELSEDGTPGLGVFVQDQTTPPVDLYFTQAVNPTDELASPTVIDDTIVQLVDASGFTVGDFVGIFSGVSGERRFYFGTVQVIGAPNPPNTLQFDTPLDFAFDAGDPVLPTTRDLNVNGSITSQTFSVQAGGVGGSFAVDITRIILEITTLTDPDFTDFGDITGGLVNGVVLRRVDGTTQNIWNVKTNSEFGNIAYDYQPIANLAPGPGGDKGILVRYTFAGQDKHGVAVRLQAGDSLELIIQDDLTTLTSYRTIAAGHIVQ